mgnify:CR=1 FL=1
METQTQFEVWLRVKPYSKMKPEKQNANMINQAKQRVQGIQDRSPSASARNRSKSPMAMSQSYICKIKEGQNEIGKSDFRGIAVSPDNSIVIDPEDHLAPAISVRSSRSKHQSINFPNILKEDCTNMTIFQSRVKDQVERCFEGGVFTMLTYGISGSGKTYTIFGNNKDPGAMLLSTELTFDKKEKLKQTKNVNVQLSMVEIYNEKAYDLLAEDLRTLAIVDSPFGDGVILPDLKVQDIESFEKFKEVFFKAQERRIVCPNLNNMNSSRSHVIVELKLLISDKENADNCVLSRLRFVDLAGSEKVYFDEKDLAQEGSNINKSLLALTSCINILSDEKKRAIGAFVPYRNSKLTRLLKDSLCGDQPVLLVVCISQNGVFLEETLNSIKYAEKAMRIKPTPTRLSTLPIREDLYLKKIAELEKEVKFLRKQLKTPKPPLPTDGSDSPTLPASTFSPLPTLHLSDFDNLNIHSSAPPVHEFQPTTQLRPQPLTSLLSSLGPLYQKLYSLDNSSSVVGRNELSQAGSLGGLEKSGGERARAVENIREVESSILEYVLSGQSVPASPVRLIGKTVFEDRNSEVAEAKQSNPITIRPLKMNDQTTQIKESQKDIEVCSPTKSTIDEYKEEIEFLREEVKVKSQQISELSKAIKNLTKPRIAAASHEWQTGSMLSPSKEFPLKEISNLHSETSSLSGDHHNDRAPVGNTVWKVNRNSNFNCVMDSLTQSFKPTDLESSDAQIIQNSTQPKPQTQWAKKQQHQRVLSNSEQKISVQNSSLNTSSHKGKTSEISPPSSLYKSNKP